MRKKSIITIFLLVITAQLCISNALSQPNNKPKNQKKETTADEVFKRIIEEDLAYIITKPELDAFKKLETNEERENFIDIIWRIRDPNPDTEENEFRDEHYERIAYANEKFTSGIPGWKTDRGRIYIARGKPDSIESHPSGGSYQRASYEGGGSTTTYPFETWFYRNVDGVGSGIEIEFVDPTGTGEYRIARNANEKDALLNVPGAGQTLAEQIGLETRADRISGFNNNTSRVQDSPFERLRITTDIFKAPPISNNLPFTTVSSPLLDENPLNFDVRVDYFRQSDDKVVATFTVQAKNKELTYKDVGGIQTARMNIFGRVTQVSGKRAGTFQDVVTTTATADELKQNDFRSSIYQQTVILPAGIYKTEINVRDIETGNGGTRTIGFTVPKFGAEKLSASTLILASRLYQTTEKDIGGRFVIGDKKVIPNLSSEYKQGQEIGIYMQVYNAGIDQTTLRPAVDVEYILIKDGKEVLKKSEDWNGLSEAGQRLILARFLETEKLLAGEYELKIKVQDRVNNQVIEPSAKFRIVE